MKDKKIIETFITPYFRVSFPNVFAPAPDPSGRMKYGVTMYFPKTTDMSGFKVMIDKVAKGNFGPDVDMASLKLPLFRDGDKPTATGKVIAEAKGHWVVKASSNDRFKAVRADNPKIECTPEELYAGCWARAILAIAPFVHAVGGRGVTMYINGIQKVKDDAPFSGRPRVEDVFDAVAQAPAQESSTPW